MVENLLFGCGTMAIGLAIQSVVVSVLLRVLFASEAKHRLSLTLASSLGLFVGPLAPADEFRDDARHA